MVRRIFLAHRFETSSFHLQQGGGGAVWGCCNRGTYAGPPYFEYENRSEGRVLGFAGVAGSDDRRIADEGRCPDRDREDHSSKLRQGWKECGWADCATQSYECGCFE